MNTPCLKPIIEPVDFVNSMNFLKKNADSSELFTPVHVFPLNFFVRTVLQAEAGISHQNQAEKIPSQNS